MLPNLKKIAKSLTLIGLFQIAAQAAYAQVDTVYTNNQKIACSVKEITPDAVKYAYPGEDLINSIYKNTVQKIVFKSGRVQTFAESTSFKAIKGVMDYNNVTMTSVEGEIKGLYKLSDVSSKAKGATTLSSQERVKDRAYKKLKIQAAMFGGNVILLTDKRTEGNKYGGYYESGSPTETNLTGIAYSNTLPDYEAFKKLIGDKKDFIAANRYELGASDADVSLDEVDKPFTITKIDNENGVIYLEGNLKGETNVFRFQLAGITESTFSIAYKWKGTAYNFMIKL
jgi:hypothetical protein